MQDQAKQKIEQPVADTKSQPAAAVSPREHLPRRRMFSVGLVGLIAEACSNAEFSGGLAGKPVARDNRKGDSPVQPATQDPATQSPVLPPSQDASQNCNAIANPQVDIPPNVVEKPVVSVFYGRQDSAMLALVLPAGEDIKQVVIANSKGRLLALHGITGADKKADGSWRPIVIDGLALVDQGVALNEIVVLMQLPNSRAKAVLPISFMNKFGNKPVVDLSGRAVPTNMPMYQSVAQFGELASSTGFAVDNNVSYPNLDGQLVRNLHTALPVATWSIGPALKGTITDVMGNVIDRTNFSILEHQVFCTYVEMPDGKVARTMIHVG